MLVGGEALPAALARVLMDRVSEGVFNMYGPTETTVWSTVHQLRTGAYETVPIGKPVANTQVYVLDPCMEPVAVGVAGELYIGGAGLARGYLNRPDLTAERFLPNPFSARAGECFYRTGDRVRWLPQGELEFLGRLDEQVKLRGHRIETGEVEAALREQPGVAEAAVVLREDLPEQKRLVAYVTAAGGAAGFDPEQLQAGLRNRLPEYMVPNLVVLLDSMPLTVNGKLDREALPAPEHTALATQQEYAGPTNSVEATLCAIWAEVLQRHPISVQDNFFELGGHSLLATPISLRH